ncbi:MAG: hypothetical protein QOC64_3751, partial [Solirubrobacteraceae bacterium]|nr:hypothetical protein [Solirubrobacteraceae bacterium]
MGFGMDAAAWWRTIPVLARRLAEAIPGARLRVWRGAGHFYVTDEPRADRDVA